MVKIQIPDGFDLELPPHISPKWSRFGSNLLKILASIFEADGTTCYVRIELSWGLHDKQLGTVYFIKNFIKDCFRKPQRDRNRNSAMPFNLALGGGFVEGKKKAANQITIPFSDEVVTLRGKYEGNLSLS